MLRFGESFRCFVLFAMNLYTFFIALDMYKIYLHFIVRESTAYISRIRIRHFPLIKKYFNCLSIELILHSAYRHSMSLREASVFQAETG